MLWENSISFLNYSNTLLQYKYSIILLKVADYYLLNLAFKASKKKFNVC